MRWFIIQPKRNKRQQAALETALKIYNSDPDKYKNTMFCPYCGQPLVKSGEKRRFQTLSEHVSDPNATPSMKEEYICSAEGLFDHQYLLKDDPDSQLGCEFGILHAWNGDHYGENGGNYKSEYWYKLAELSRESIINKRVIDQYFHEDSANKFGCALNTFNCQSEVSIYCTGLPRQTLLPAWLTFNKIQLMIEYSYSADYFGRVISRHAHLRFLKKDGNRNDFCILGIWPWDTWKFLLHQFNRQRKYALKIKDEEPRMHQLLKCYAKPYNDAWIYRAFTRYISKIHHKELKSVLNYFNLTKIPSSYDAEYKIGR